MYSKLSGHDGLLIAIIYQAAKDARGKDARLKRDAMEFFTGDWYATIMESLGLPLDWLPQGVG